MAEIRNILVEAVERQDRPLHLGPPCTLRYHTVVDGVVYGHGNRLADRIVHRPGPDRLAGSTHGSGKSVLE